MLLLITSNRNLRSQKYQNLILEFWPARNTPTNGKEWSLALLSVRATFVVRYFWSALLLLWCATLGVAGCCVHEDIFKKNQTFQNSHPPLDTPTPNRLTRNSNKMTKTSLKKYYFHPWRHFQQISTIPICLRPPIFISRETGYGPPS